MTNYNKYGEVAIKVAKAKGNPKDNWLKEIKNTFFDSESSQKKSCPKSAFLGLCEEGLIKGIKHGVYLTNSKSNLNKRYALSAVKLLTNNPNFTKEELWKQVMEQLNISISPNSQMDVVIALFEKKMIVL